MKFVALRELKINPSKVIDEAGKDGVVITRNGKPAAALIYLDEDLLDDFIIARHPTLLKELEESRRDYLEHGGVSLKEVRKKLARRRAAGKKTPSDE